MAENCYKLLLSCLWVTMMLTVNSSAAEIKIVPLKKNMKTFNDWACSKPQPRMIHIENLDEYSAPNVIYLPSALVIHQCDQSTGCCKTPGQVCKSVESVEEKVQFAVRAISNSGSGADSSPAAGNRRIKSKKERKVMVSLTNHTLCECVGKVDLRV